MKKLTLDAAVLAAFPGLAVTGVVARYPADHLLEGGATQLLARVASAQPGPPVDPLDLAVVKEWRDAYRKMGLKPSDHRSSVESLVRRALRGGFPAIGIAAVDLYNATSALQQAPMGGYDLAQLGEADITVRFADPALDTFVPIGGHPERFQLTNKVVVYGQPGRVLCWAFNCRDNAETSVQGTTTEALFLSEALNAAAAESSRAAIEFLDLALRGAGADTALLGIADAAAPAIDIRRPVAASRTDILEPTGS